MNDNPIPETPQADTAVVAQVVRGVRPLREGEVMGLYLDFDRHADKTLPPAEYLLRFGAAVSEATVKVNQDRNLTQERSLALAVRQWDRWKAYALELQARLVKYEGGSPMVLNAPERPSMSLLAEDRALG